MRLDLAIQGDLRQYMEGRAAVMQGGLHKAAGLAAAAVKDRYRAAVAPALGQRVANTVRGVVYPRAAAQLKTGTPTAFVFSKAPKLIQAFAFGATIRPVKGSRYLWIPTENVPRLRNKPMKPAEVEERFGAKFVYLPITSGARRGSFLAVVPAIAGKNGKGFRKATAGRRTGTGKQAGRVVEDVPMFVLVKQVTLSKRIDFAAVEAWAAAEWANIVARSLADAFRDDEAAAA